MWSKQFALDASWRAFRTFCQTLAAMLGGETVNVLTVDWKGLLGVSVGSALVSLLMSVDRERVVTPTAAEPLVEGCGGDLR